MPDVKPLADDLFVCAFVPPEKIAELAPRFGTIINNRPDGEEPGQPSSAQIEAEARRQGIDYVHLPIVPGRISNDEIAAFGDTIAHGRRPFLAFCRSGTRSTTLWALSQSGKRSRNDILDRAAAAGYDLSAIAGRLEEKAAGT